MKELTKQQIRKYEIDRSRLIKGSEKSMYVHEAVTISIIMQTRLSKPETIKFRSDLVFSQINLTLKKRTISSNTINKSIFCRKNRATAEALEIERIRNEMYFSEHKLVVEIDEKRIY